MYMYATACQWYGFVAGICGLNSINTLALIAVDRYKVISQPLRSLYAVSARRSALLVGVAWLWAAVWAVPPLTSAWGRYIGCSSASPGSGPPSGPSRRSPTPGDATSVKDSRYTAEMCRCIRALSVTVSRPS